MNIISGSGDNYDIKHVTVNSTTDTEITFTRPVKSFKIRELNAQVHLELRRTENATYWDPIFPGEAVTFPITIGNRGGSTAATYNLGWIRCKDAPSATAVIFVTY